MRLLHWLDYKTHDLWVGIGDWALRKPHRPFIVWTVTCVVVAAGATGVIELTELVTGRQ